MISSIRNFPARMLPGVAVILAGGFAMVSGCADTPARNAPTFAAFVDRYLDDFTRRHPSIAAGNGLHGADSTLDDFSADAIAREISELKRDQAVLQAFRAEDLTPDERVDQKILDGVIDGWLLEQEPSRTGVAIRCCMPPH